MIKLIKFFIISLLSGFICCICPALSFALSGRIIANNYLTHYSPGQAVTFTVTFQNTAAVLDNVYLDVVLTNRATGAEELINLPPNVYPGSDTRDINAGETVVLTTNADVPFAQGGGGLASGRRGLNWTARAGSYTVTLIVYSTGGGNPELARVSGAVTINVGSNVDSVASFPRVLDLGTLQYGRYMHPVPIEINWNFFSYSDQVRKAHPWYMRIYTDNHKRYQGVDGAIYAGRTATQESGSVSAIASPAGLISEDGRYTISLKIWCLNFGPDVEEGWDTNALGPPPVTEDYYWKGPLLDSGERDRSRVAWERIPDYIDMTADSGTWRKLIGQDPYDTHYASDSNPAGDFTLTSPFQVFIAYETSPVSVMGKYSADLIIEIYSP